MDQVYEMVGDWKAELRKELVYYGALILVNFIGWGFMRRALGEMLNSNFGIKWEGFPFQALDHTLETILIAVVVALVVAAAIVPRGVIRQAGEAKVRANLLALSLIARAVALLYPTYFVFFIVFMPTSELKNADAYLRIFISILVGVVLTALAVVIKEIELFQWEDQKKKEGERDRFREHFRATQNSSQGQAGFLCKTAPKWKIWWSGTLIILVLLFIGSSLVVAFLLAAIVWKVFCAILLIVVSTILGVRTHMWIAKSSGVVWVQCQEPDRFFRFRTLKRYRTSGTPIEYIYYCSMGALAYIFILLIICLFVAEAFAAGGGYGGIAGLFIIFVLPLGIAWCYFSFSVFRFNPFPYIEESFPEEDIHSHRVSQFNIKFLKAWMKRYGVKFSSDTPRVPENLNVCQSTKSPKRSDGLYVPDVKFWEKILFPAGYRVFAVERVCAILNGKRVPATLEENSHGKRKLESDQRKNLFREVPPYSDTKQDWPITRSNK